MTGFRAFFALCVSLSMMACTEGSFQNGQQTTRFDTAPLGFTQNPRMTTALNQTFITNEAELQSVADRITAEQLDVTVSDDTESISARSVISPL